MNNPVDQPKVSEPTQDAIKLLTDLEALLTHIDDKGFMLKREWTAEVRDSVWPFFDRIPAVRAALIGIPGAEKGEAVKALGYADEEGRLLVPDDQIGNLVHAMESLPKPPVGRKLLPLYLHPAPTSERVQALTYATNLLVSFVNEHCDPVPEWKPLPDLVGVLTQLDNATTVTQRLKAALREIAAEDFEGSKGISVYGAATNELKRRTEIARAALKATP